MAGAAAVSNHTVQRSDAGGCPKPWRGLQRIAWAGQDHNLCLGYPTVDPYLTNPGKLGAIVGRYANRINQAQALVDGVPYKFDANNGAHCLHGGRETLGLRAFDVLEHSGSHVVLFQRMPDGHMGFPGALDVWVTYRLQGATLGIDIRAKTDAPRCAISRAMPISTSQAHQQSPIINYRWPHRRFWRWTKRVSPVEQK